MKSIWKCRPTVGRHFDVGFINQALLAKVSPLDKAPFCGSKKLLLSVGIPTNQIGTWFKLPEHDAYNIQFCMYVLFGWLMGNLLEGEVKAVTIRPVKVKAVKEKYSYA